MERRSWFKTALAGVAGHIPAQPAVEVPPLSPRLELAVRVERGAAIVGGLAALVDVRWAEEHAGPTVAPWNDIPQWAKVATIALPDARLDDSGWLRASDTRFPAVTGNPALLAVGVVLSDGSQWLVGVAAGGHFYGLPFAPCGNDCVVQWPRCGIVKVTL